jgi:DNA-binding beta-propeller fold protein YncE
MKPGKVLQAVALAGFALCGAAVQGEALLVVNKSGHTLWALDLESGERLASFETGLGPHEVEVSPDGCYVVVSNYGERETPGNSLTVIDWQAREVVRAIDLGTDTRPHGLAFRPDGLLVVTTEGSDRLLVVDVARGEVLRRIPIGEGVGHMVAVSHNGRYAWVTNISAGSLEKIDLEAGQVVGLVRTGAGAEGVALTPDEREVWVTNRADDTVAIVDSDSVEVLKTLESLGFPIRVAMTPDDQHALITNAVAASLSVLDIAERTLIATPVLADPDAEYLDTLLGRAALPIGLAVHPDGSRVFVALAGADRVAIIDTDEWQVTGHWETGREPDGLAIIHTARDAKPH